MPVEEFIRKLNTWGHERRPFLFLTDFEMADPLAFPLDEINAAHLLFNINGITNANTQPVETKFDFKKNPLPFLHYKQKFDRVHAHLAYGDSYLVNLTVKTQVDTRMSLRELFFVSQAKYKILFEDRFLVFSPETFVKMQNGKIFSYPMKGTIDASLPDAMNAVLSSPKERAEHVTIVDLIRNDLSRVAEHVQVTKFRYVDEIRTHDKTLLQVSSEIQGDLPPDYLNHLGNIFLELLPAGSVSGAPKRRTVEIIREAENESRGYYTGVVGLFDGKTVDSGVMIRFIERHQGAVYYRSGGGITIQSNPEAEYQETIDKVYVPFN